MERLDTAGPPSYLAFAETLFAVLIALQFPPGLLGHNAIPVQLALAALGIAYIALRGPDPLYRITIRPVRFFALVILYIFAAHVIIEPESLLVGVKELVIGGIGLIFIGTLIQAARPRDILVAFVVIYAAVGLSELLLFGARVAGVDQALSLGYFPIKDYRYVAHWYFPWSLTYAQPIGAGGSVWERGLGLSREPGVHQAFALSASCGALLLRDLPWRRSMAVIIALGSAFTLSTAWLASMGALIIWATFSHIDLRKASSLLVASLLLIAIGALGVVAVQAPGFGFSDKLSGESGQDRLRAVESLGPTLAVSPWWGLGQSTRLQQEVITSVSGSLVVGIARLGLIGSAILLIAMAATLLERHDRRSILLVIPIGVTLLVSQPLYYSIVAYFIFALPGRAALMPLPTPIAPRPLPPVPPVVRQPVPPSEPPLVILDD